MSETWTVLRLLGWCRDYFARKNIETPRLDAEVLVAHVLGVDRLGLYLRYDQPLTPEELAQVRELVRRRAAREPVAHLVGTKEFYGLSVDTDGRAMVPRPESELLVETVLAALPAKEPQRICDLGTGTGCLAIALLCQRPAWSVVGIDCSETALKLAAQNAEKRGVADRFELRCGDLLAGVSETFDAVMCNPPYVPTTECEELMPEVAEHDPRVALDGGPDGLDIIRRLVEQVPGVLVEHGLLVMEVGAGQAERVVDLLRRGGRYERIEVEQDLSGKPRAIRARKKESD